MSKVQDAQVDLPRQDDAALSHKSEEKDETFPTDPNIHPSRLQALAQKHPLMHEGPPRQHPIALADNTEILKAININKMQHQYIQNLQKANMTLKCKIKEVSELVTEQDCLEFAKDQKFNEQEERHAADDLQDEFDLQMIGTIEEQTVREAIRKRRQSGRKKAQDPFYDRNSIGRSVKRKQSRPSEDVRDSAPDNFYDKNLSREPDSKPSQKFYREDRADNRYRGEQRTRYSQRRGPYPETYKYMDRYERHERQHVNNGFEDHFNADRYSGWEKYEARLPAPAQTKSFHDKNEGPRQFRQEPNSIKSAKAKEHKKPYVKKERPQVSEKKFQSRERKESASIWSTSATFKTQKPAVAQAKLKTAEPGQAEKRDLRPAIFISDISKRSLALEEEKTQHFIRKRQEKNASVTASIKGLEAAIKAKDTKQLADCVYQAKLVQVESKSEKECQALEKLISEAQQCLVGLSLAKQN